MFPNPTEVPMSDFFITVTNAKWVFILLNDVNSFSRLYSETEWQFLKPKCRDHNSYPSSFWPTILSQKFPPKLSSKNGQCSKNRILRLYRSEIRNFCPVTWSSTWWFIGKVNWIYWKSCARPYSCLMSFKLQIILLTLRTPKQVLKHWHSTSR